MRYALYAWAEAHPTLAKESVAKNKSFEIVIIYLFF